MRQNLCAPRRFFFLAPRRRSGEEIEEGTGQGHRLHFLWFNRTLAEVGHKPESASVRHAQLAQDNCGQAIENHVTQCLATALWSRSFTLWFLEIRGGRAAGQVFRCPSGATVGAHNSCCLQTTAKTGHGHLPLRLGRSAGCGSPVLSPPSVRLGSGLLISSQSGKE